MKKMTCAICALALSFLFVSCRNSVELPENKGVEQGLQSDQIDYSNCYFADELIDAIKNLDVNHEIFPKTPALSAGGIEEIELVYIDDRTDETDSEGRPCGVATTDKKVFKPAQSYPALKAPDSLRSGWEFLGWELRAADYGLDIASEITKCLRKYLKNYSGEDRDYADSELVSYFENRLMGEKEFNLNCLETRLFQPGDSIKDYFENVIITFFANNHYYDSVNKVYSKEFPYRVELHAVWKHSMKRITVEYHDYIYNKDNYPERSGKMTYVVTDQYGNETVKDMPHRDMYYGTPYFGKLTSIVPVRTGFDFVGWSDGNRTIKYADILSDANAEYFNEAYEDGDVCELYPEWKQLGSFYCPLPVQFITNDTNTGFSQCFTSLPSLVSPVSYGVSVTDLGVVKPGAFAIASEDVSGAQLKALLNANKCYGWGFEELGYKNKFGVSATDDFWYDGEDEFVEEIVTENGTEKVDLRKNKIVVSGVEIDYDARKIKNAGDGTDYSYPIVLLDLPQAMLICNMFTAAYNTFHTDKLTYAYARGEDTSLLWNESTGGQVASRNGVIKTMNEAVQYIKERHDIAPGKSLARENATGFRLPTACEYQLASSIIPSSDDDSFLGANKDNLVNSAYPVYVKDTSLFSSLFGECYLNKTAMEHVSNDRSEYKNPIGMYHAVGNVRKWLDGETTSGGDTIVLSDMSMTDTVTIAIPIPHKFNNQVYLKNKKAYDITSWFPNFKNNKISASLSSINIVPRDGDPEKFNSKLTFVFSYTRKAGDDNAYTVVSDLYMPNELLEDVLCSEEEKPVLRQVVSNAATITMKASYVKDLTDYIKFTITVPYTFDVNKYSQDDKAYDVTSWFPGLEGTGIKVSYVDSYYDSKKSVTKMTFAFTYAQKGGIIADYTSDLVLPVSLIKGKTFASGVANVKVASKAVKIGVRSSRINFMVRSGSFMQSDAAEGHVHKYFDQKADLRRSSSPYNYAFYDLGMRLVRSI